MRIVSTALLTAIAILAGVSVISAETVIGKLTLDKAVVRATAEGTKATGGYLSIENAGHHADRLMSVTVDFAGKAEIHTMKIDNGVMKMRPLPDGLEIPAGETVTLKRGGDHLMFMKLQQPMAKGEEVTVTLTFEKAGSVELPMKIVDDAMLAEMFKGGHSGHKHSDHGHKDNDQKDHNH